MGGRERLSFYNDYIFKKAHYQSGNFKMHSKLIDTVNKFRHWQKAAAAPSNVLM